ncbi:MAG: hypothetical protein LBK02_07595 [Treponema sp.]|nr:hypothetical protein [Treponema sp.]
MSAEIRRCRVCGCTDDDCHQCIEKTGHPCHWVEEDLCSACAGDEPEEYDPDFDDDDEGLSGDDEYGEDFDGGDDDFIDEEDGDDFPF